MGVKMAAKTSLDLKREVWDTGRCSGCGACVAVCPGDSLSFDEGTMVTSPKNCGYCKQDNDSVPCGACYAVCPRVVDQPAETLGKYLELYAAKAEFEIPHRQSGGAVTAILMNALDEGLIDAVVTVTEDRWTLRPSSVIITKSDVLVQQAGSRYSSWCPSSLRSRTPSSSGNTRRSRLSAYRAPSRRLQGCARATTISSGRTGNRSGSIIGLFCTESFDYEMLIHGKLRSHYHIEPQDIRKLDVKGKLEVLRQDNTTTIVPLSELEECIRKGCHYCTDTTALLSDISAGSVGTPAGFTTLIVRSYAGKGFVDSAVAHHRAGRKRGCRHEGNREVGGREDYKKY